MKAMQNLSFVLGICMAFLVVVGAVVFLFTNWIDSIPAPNRTWLGWMFVIYGAYRIQRLYVQYKNLKRKKK